LARRDNAIRAGDVIGEKYVVERVIGQGGMGIVLAARHAELQQRVAVKVLPDSQADDGEMVERFMREARAAARLKSEHAVKVIDVGRRKRSGAPYIVMELLQGEDLGALVERGGQLAIPDAVDFVLQACEAVAEAHALGIIHRDLKPRNLFLSMRIGGARPIVKVLDFGLAKRIDYQDKSLTSTQAVMGSPQYMSPEQMRSSRDVDIRTDIWSLGVCLYELLCGRVPFESDAVAVLCAMVLKDPAPPATTFRRDLPLPLEAILARCLAKDPSQRFANVGELAAVLEPFGVPESRGAAERVWTVLQTPATASQDEAGLGPRFHDTRVDSGDTRTAATFDSVPNSSLPIGRLVAVCAAFAVVGMILIGIVGFRVYQARQVQGLVPSAEPILPATGDPPVLTPIPIETTIAPTSTSIVDAGVTVAEVDAGKHPLPGAGVWQAPTAKPTAVPTPSSKPTSTPTPKPTATNPADHM
jgi:serine/threonine-protein kinase